MSKRKTRRAAPSGSPGAGSHYRPNGSGSSRAGGGSSSDEPGKMKKAEAELASTQSSTFELPLYLQWALVLLVILGIAAIRVRLLNFPLERDEGEYAYAGQLILQGIPPYELAYNMKLPGTYYAYAGILYLFGQTPKAVHLGLLIVNAAAILLVFLLTKRMFGGIAGVAASASYGILTISPAVLGFAAHATHFVVLPALGGLLLLQMAISSKKLWLFFTSGALLGLAFLAKQPGALLLLFGGLYLLKSEWAQPLQFRILARRAVAFALGAFAPFALICLILYRAGVFGKFWFWTFSYAREYGTIVSLDKGFEEFLTAFPHVLILTAGIWILAAAGIYFLLSSRKLRTHATFMIGFLVFSFFAVSAGLYYRPHYFVLMLPAVAILAGLGVSAGTERFSQTATLRDLKFVPSIVFLLAMGFSVFILRQYLFQVDPAIACRLVYGFEPFPEALEVGKYIRDHTPESARIVVMGSEPEIYFYSHRHSATGYIYMYALLEKQKYALTMQQEMIQEIESAKPDFLVVVKGPPEHWGMTSDSETMVFTWATKYVDQYYALQGTVDVRFQSDYHWENDLKNAQLVSPISLWVFKRKS